MDFSKVTSFLPHRRVPVPCLKAPSRRMSVFIDSELGIPFNRREPELVKAILDLIAEDDVVFDIGARFGYYTLLLENRGCDVHAFEPHPGNVTRLREHVSLNRLDRRVTVVQKAVAEESTEMDLILRDESTHTIDSARSGETLSVETTTIDGYCRSEGVTPDFVKIDVEGAGDRVLKGSSGTIDRAKTTWVMEIHNDTERTCLEESFSPASYVTFALGSGHVVAQPSENTFEV